MQGKTKERWQALCEQAAIEQDPDRLMELIRELDQLLQDKHGRLRKETQPSATADDASCAD